VALVSEARPLGWADCRNLVESNEALVQASDTVNGLTFSMLKRKLREERGWTGEYVDEVEDLYRKFLVLNVVYPDRKICPTGPVDEFWHAHILDTRAYAADCERLFGTFLHHFPYFGMRDAADRADLETAFSESRSLFIRHFGIDPCSGDAQARACSPQRCP
jgi:hypothetical protein